MIINTMQNKWYEIWNREERIDRFVLEVMLKADGFDTGPSRLTVDQWLAYTESMYRKIGLRTPCSVFEVGCGSGAFLYPLYRKGFRVSGVDYSRPLIELAKGFMPAGSFEVKEAAEIESHPRATVVVSHGVFPYFPDHDYAYMVLKKMIDKAEKSVAILDVNDEEKRDKYDQLRRAFYENPEEYDMKYRDLKHLFYSKDWFRSIAEELGLAIKISDQDFKDYGNSALRFNVFIEKP